MDSQTVRTALGQLQDDPDSQNSWQELQSAIEQPDGDLERDELKRLLSAARDLHQRRGEWQAVATLLNIHAKVCRGESDEADLLDHAARVHREELLDDETALQLYQRLLEVRPDDGAAQHAVEEVESKRGSWKDLVQTYLGEAEEAPDEVYKSSMLMRAAEMELRFGEEESIAERASERLEQAVRLDPTNARASRMLERVYRRREAWEETARVLERLSDRAESDAERTAASIRLARVYVLKLDDSARAARAYQAALRVTPTESEARSFLTEYFSTEERWDDLVALYERDLQKSDMNNAEKIGDMLQIAMLHWKKREKADDADEWFERVHKLEAAHPLALNFFREYLTETGDEGRLVGVLQQAQRVMKDGPEKTELAQEIGRLAESQQNAQKAIEQYKGVLRQDPTNEEARDALKRLYRQTEGYNALVELLRQQLERTPKDDSETRLVVLREVATVYRQSIKSDTALVSVLNQIVSHDPSDIGAVRELVALYGRLERWRDLVKNQQRLADLTEDEDEKVELYRGVARTWLERFSNVQNAIDAYEGLLSVAPADAEATERLAELYKKRRAWPALFALYEKELERSDGPARLPIMKDMAALAAERLQNPDRAIALFKEILEAEPSNLDALDSLERYAERGKRWQDLADALERRFVVVDDEPTKLQVLQRLGMVYGDHLSDAEKATGAWGRLLEIQPGHQRAMRVLRDAYLKSGDYDRLNELYAGQNDYAGLADVLSSAADKTKDPEAKVDLSYRAAEVYEQFLESPDRAFRSYERVLAVRPNDLRAAQALIPLYEGDEKWARLPALYQVLLEHEEETSAKLGLLGKLVEVTGNRLNDRPSAASFARQAYELEPTSDDALQLFEESCRSAGTWDEFVQALEAQLGADEAVEPEVERRLRLRLARVYGEELGQTDEAVRSYRALLEKEPNDADAVNALEQILRREGKRDELRWLLELRVEHAASDGDRLDVLTEWAALEEDVFEEPQRAVQIHRRILELDTGAQRSLASLAQLLGSAEDYAGAATVIEQHRELLDGAERADKEAALAEIYLTKLGRHADALEAAVRTLDLVDADPRAMNVLNQLLESESTRERAAEVLATQYATSGEARNEAQAIEVMLQTTTDPAERMNLFGRLADVQEEKLGAFGSAFDVILKALRESPTEVSLWDRANHLAELSGRPTDLAETYREVLRGDVDPAVEIDLCERAAALHEDKLGDPIGATPYLEKVLAAQPGNEAAFVRLKDILTAAERWGELESLYDRASQATDDDSRRTEMLTEVALICEEITEEPEKATKYYERIVEIDPLHDSSVRALDRLYAKQERHEDLAKLLERRIETAAGDESLDMRLRLARIQLERLHQPDKAVDHVEDVLSERPGDYDARELAEKMLEIGTLKARAARMLELVYDGRDEVRDLVRVLEVRLQSLEEAAEGADADPDREVERQDLLRRIATLKDERLHDDEGAFNALAKLVPEQPLDLEARQRILEIAGRTDSYARVAEVLEAASAQSDSIGVQAEILAKVASIYEEQLGEADKAETVHRRILELDGDDAEIALPAARALERLYLASESHDKLAGVLRTQVRLEADGDTRRSLLGRLGELCQNTLSDSDGAISAWSQRLEDDPEDATALQALDELYEKQERWTDLVSTLERRQDIASDSDERRELMVRSAEVRSTKLEDPNDAIDAWRAVVDEFGPAKQPLEALEPLYRRAERWDELAEVYETHLDLVEDVEPRLELLAKLGDLRRSHLNNVEGALEAYRQALMVDPAHAPSRAALVDVSQNADPAARREAAEVLHPIYDADGDFQKLLDVIEIEIECSEDPLQKLEGLEKAIGVADEQLEDQERAYGYAEQAVRTAVGHTEIEPRLETLERLARATGRQKQYVQLLTDVVPEIFDGDVQLGVTLKIADLAREQLGDRELAQEYYQKALEIRGEDRRALVALESLYAESEDADSLLGILERRAETAEDDDERKQLLFRRAKLLDETLENTPDAIRVYEDIIAGETDPEAVQELDRLYRKSERWQDLIELYQRQLDESPDRGADLRVSIAKVASQQGDVMRAFDEIEAALSEDSTHDGAIAELERVLGESEEPEQRARAATLLEPVYLARGDFERVMGTIEARLAHTDEPDERRDLLTRLAQLHEEQKEDYGAALDTVALLLHEDLRDEETVEELERLAKVAGAEKRLAEIYAKELEEVASDEPETAKLSARTGELYASIGESDLALKYYRRALAFEPESLTLFERIDSLLKDAERPAERVELYQAALDHRFEPHERLELLHTIASVQRDELKEPEAAIDTYRSALDVDENDTRSLDALTELYRAGGKTTDLSELYLRRAESAPSLEDGAPYRLALARLCRAELEDPARAIDQLEEVVQGVPSHREAVTELETFLEDPDHKERVVEILRPLYEDADDWKRLVKLNEDRFQLADAPSDKAQVLRETARLWEERGADPSRARRALAAAVALDADDGELRADYERLTEQTEAWDELAATYEAALESQPDLASRRDVLAQLARVQDEKRDDPRRALEAYERLRQTDESDLEPIEKMEQLATLLSDWPTLVRVLTAKADLLLDDEERASVWRRVGEAKRDMLEDQPGAVEAYERAAELDPDSAFTIDCLIELYENGGEPSRLVELYNRRVEMCDEDDDELKYNLLTLAAKTYEEKLSDRQSAIESLGQALAAQPGDRTALASLNRLYRTEEMWPELLENLKLEASTAESDEDRIGLRRQAGDILSEKLSSYEDALEAYRSVLDEAPSDDASRDAVMRLGKDHEHLREGVAEILVPVLRSTEKHSELAEVLEMRFSVETDPAERSETLRTIAEVHESHLGSPNEALSALLRALSEAPDAPDLHTDIERLSEASDGWGRYADALFERAQATFDADVAKDLYARLGRIAEEKLSDDKRAVEAYRHAVEQAGDQPELMSALDRLYGRLGDSQSLSEILERRVMLADSDADHADLQYRMAKLQLDEFNEPGRAMLALRAALERNPEHEDALAAMEKLTDNRDLFDEASEVLEGVYREQGKTDRLAALFEKRVGFADSAEERVDMRQNLARVLEEDCGDPAAAQRVLQQGLADDPTNGAVLDELERLAPMTGDWGGAASALVRAVKGDPESGGADILPDTARELLVRAAVWFRDRADDKENAEKALSAASDADPASDDVLMMLEELQGAEGRERELVSTLRKRAKLQLDDERREELFRRAVDLAKQASDAALAEEVLRELLDADDSNLWALAELTRIRQDAEDYKSTFDLLVRRAELVADAGEVRALRHEAAAIARDYLANPDQAIEIYEHLFEDEPSDDEAASSLKSLFILNERWEKLGSLLERLIDVAEDPSVRSSLRLELATLCDQRFETPDRAIDLLQAVLEEQPGHSDAVVRLSELLEKTGRDEQLAQLLSEQINIARDNGDAEAELKFQTRLGEIYETRLGDRDKAIETYNHVLERDAQHRGALEALARLHAASGNHSGAAEILERLLDMSDGDDAVKLSVVLADTYEQLDDKNSAARALERGLARDESNADLRGRLAGLYRATEQWEPLASLIAGDADAAEEDNEKVRLLREAAKIHAEHRDDHASAAELLEKANAAKPEDREIMLELCDAYSSSGRGKDAVGVLEKIVESYGGKRSKELGDIHRRLATAYLADGEKERALAELDRAFRIEPGNVHILKQLGEVSLETGDLKKAQQMFRALLIQRLTPEAPITKAEAFFRLAQVHSRLDEKPKAIQNLERALREDPSLSEAKELLDELKG